MSFREQDLQEFYYKLGPGEYRTNWLITRWCIYGETKVLASPHEMRILNEGRLIRNFN